jgi:hypothetical protein
MIEFNETINDLNNAKVFEVTFSGQKIGTLMKNNLTKKYYLGVLGKSWELPFKAKKFIPKLVQGALDSLHSDLIMQSIKRSGWTESRWITLEKAKHTQT